MNPFFWGNPPAPTAATPKPEPPFVPRFEEHFLTSAFGGKYPLNRYYFADEATANEMMERFGAQYVFMQPAHGAGGPNTVDGQERWLHWSDGTEINAGVLAAYFDRNPEAQFPGVAMKLAMHGIATARAGR